MLYLVLVPGWVWAVLLGTTLLALFYLVAYRLEVRSGVLIGLLATMAVQALGATAAALTTDTDPISGFACLTGFFGLWGSVGVAGAGALGLGYLSRTWPRDARGGRQRFGACVLLWIAFTLIALLAFTRSALMCTV